MTTIDVGGSRRSPPRRVPASGSARTRTLLLARDVGRGVSPQVTFTAFAISIVAFTGYTLGNGLGLVYALMFWFAWLGYACFNRSLLVAPFAYVVPWLFPLWALTSGIWSRDQSATVRNAIELGITTMATLIAVRALTPRGVLLSLFAALLIGAIASLAGGHTETISTGMVEAMNGVFGSKNNFAMFSALLLLVAVAVALDGGCPAVVRLVGAVAVPIGIYELLVAHSIGGTVAALIGAVILVILTGIGKLPRQGRVTAGLLGLVTVIVLMLTLVFAFDASALGDALSGVGKDPTLTGRTYLWQRADETIALQRWLGVGYQAYWRQGFVDAEGLWRYLHVDARGGVSMHNLYYETAVETGRVGVGLLGFTLAATLIVSALSAILRPTPMGALSVALSLFFLSRVLLETDFLAPFTMGVMIFPLMYALATTNLAEWRRDRIARRVAGAGGRRPA